MLLSLAGAMEHGTTGRLYCKPHFQKLPKDVRESKQWAFQGANVVAYPQKPQKCLSTCLILSPTELCFVNP